MGYDIHITRRRVWLDDANDITLEEWKAYVASDPDMRLDGFWEDSYDGGVILRFEDESFAVWTSHPDAKSPDDLVRFRLGAGNIVVKNSDQAIRIKMAAIARALGARVQGDEFELYGDDGQQNGVDLPEYDSEPEAADGAKPGVPAPGGRRWWEFWK
ncbi:hypothetical protein [Prosthecodimorpha staleyi]|uniref:Uncharacterized protein n=1 Tax=Prosthecodimorpha staleyi TaxID=2840188 RepID=A0A947D8R6_9HYPH|nr:hypothetical protein [Prosthecodimorpha staleyi]MBT9293086.1 hypothetical protein [Prosthecodimorpha staleyi]